MKKKKSILNKKFIRESIDKDFIYFFDDLILNCSQVTIRERFAQFLKEECGVKERFAVHLLRKYCGHRLMRSNGIYPASKALGHKDTKLTDAIYSGLPTISATKIA